MNGKIPVSVVVATLNEEKNLPRCLAALQKFDEVLVVDSNPRDNSRATVQLYGAHFIEFSWNGQYPKKRQWCLDNLPLKHDYVFFVDADEEVTQELVDEIATLDWSCAGYFVDGLYVVDGKPMQFGMKNRKLCLFDRRYLEFPVVDDLDLPGMGEIEGHYQPVLKKDAQNQNIQRLKSPLLHHAFENQEKWDARHDDYVSWEQGMIDRNAYPPDPIGIRQQLKVAFRVLPLKGSLFFIYAYLLKGGFLEGRRNLQICRKKRDYYNRIGSK